MVNTTRTVKRPASATGAKWVNPMENPDKANAEIAVALASINEASMPVISLPPDDTVKLPGGLVKDNELIKTVTVKELTGEDEESLARASQSTNAFTFIDRLIKCGVVRVGTESASEKDKLLGQLLVGDREAIILGIRKATYGDKIEVPDWICVNCGNKSSLTMDVEDIPVTTMSDPANESTFKVPLRKGGYALARLANGIDQLATFEKPELTQAQRETVLLSRCIISLTNAAGVETSMAGFPSMAVNMSMPDRHAVLNELRDRQPGPKYDQIEYTCESCSKEVKVAVTLGHLFLDLA
jgi:hypothetical protein